MVLALAGDSTITKRRVVDKRIPFGKCKRLYI